MSTQPVPLQPRRVHLHSRARRPISLTIPLATLPIPLAVMPAHAGIQRLGSCGVGS